MLIRTITILTIFLVTACTANPAMTPAPAQDVVRNATEEPLEDTPVPSPAPADGLEKKMTRIVMNDLGARLGTDIDGIKVVSLAALTWPDAALGCPLPGKVYAQGTVPGLRIRLEAAGKEYSYHTDRTGQFVLCGAGNPDLEDLPEIPVTPG